VGPTRRPHSRGEHNSSPYGGPSVTTPTLRARQYSFGSSSDVSSSYQPRSPTSTSYDSPASYTYQSPPPVPALPQTQPQQQPPQKQQVLQSHHQHTSSTSSNSTGSPPTPGFMAPVPSPGSFANQSTAHPLPESRKSLGATSNASYNDVVMVDAPTLRTPTKEYPPQYHQNQYESSTQSKHLFQSVNKTGLMIVFSYFSSSPIYVQSVNYHS
jgi:hypothetical protein